VRKGKRMKKILSIALFLIIAFTTIIPHIAYAARPLSTDDAGVVDAGHMEIESGFEYINQNDEENNLSLVMKCGLVKNLDIGLEIPYKFIDVAQGGDVDGIGDMIITTKYHFLDETPNLPALALSFNVKTESGNSDKGLGSGEVDYSLNGIITKGINKFISHLNIGYTFVGDPTGENLDNIFSYSVALEYPLNERLNLVGEVIGETTFDRDFDDNPFSGLAGLNYGFNDTVSYDFGVGFKISEASPDYTITTGLTFGF